MNSSNTIFDNSKEKKNSVAAERLQALRSRIAHQNNPESIDRDNASSHLPRPERAEGTRITQIQTRTEFTVFSKSEHQDKIIIQQEIMSVRQELTLAIAEMKRLGQRTTEYEKAVHENIAEPGIYHLNFFSRLSSMLMVLRQNIQESSSWMDMTFAKKRAKGYWNKAKKGGTTFTLSHERKMATQAG